LQSGLHSRSALVLGLALLSAPPALGAERVLILDPAKSAIQFELPATLHTVHGHLVLARGEIHFDDAPGSGAASGEIVADARSAATDNERRDRKMHDEVLESARFPEIVLEPERLDVRRIDASHAEVTLTGELAIHGASHRISIPADLTALAPDRLRVRARFTVPYVSWGMKDVSNLVLHVDAAVEVEIDAEGSLAPPLEPAPG
jgi:polyisoprenoid-binding protein YceI